MFKNSSMSFLKGMGLGLIVGTGGAMVTKSLMSNSKSLSKGSGKIIRALGEFADGIHTMLK